MILLLITEVLLSDLKKIPWLHILNQSTESTKTIGYSAEVSVFQNLRSPNQTHSFKCNYNRFCK